mmetsp:Transcript_39518/g.51739  ORF Transcript_39518/g.51739 Transcript_39518/m.51739 type:complete len:83 (+) Transcript_39518:1015-1263(+)
MLKKAPSKSSIVAMRGLLVEAESDRENETKYSYNFLVMTTAGQVHSIQVETASSLGSSPGKTALAPSIDIKASYSKKESETL